MKKPQLIKIIRESIKELMTEQSQPWWYTAPLNANWAGTLGPCVMENWPSSQSWPSAFDARVHTVAHNNGYTGNTGTDMTNWSTIGGNPQPCNFIKNKMDGWWTRAGYDQNEITCSNVGSNQCNQLLCKLKFAGMLFTMWGCTP